MGGIRRSIAAGAVTGLLVLICGCGDEPARKPPRPPRVPAFYPEQFPDIPLPRPGYQMQPNDDQLAVALAGGSVRRFEVSMIQRENAAPQKPAELLAEVRRQLASSGWQAVSADAANQRWHKGGEDLFIETGRADSRTTIRYHLRPATAPTP